MVGLLPEVIAQVSRTAQELQKLAELLQKLVPSDTDPRYTRIKK